MSFPQPDSNAPVLAGQQFFRLFTRLASAGDMYESEVSALALAMGPNSDIANIQVNYLDEREPGLVNDVLICQDRTMTGRIDSRMDAQYPDGRRGRILISSRDLYDPTWTPVDYDPATDVIEFEAPYLDVLQYFNNPPSLIAQRSDRIHRLEYYNVPPDTTEGLTHYCIPAYGRKSGQFAFYNNGGSTLRINVYGLRFGLSENAGGVTTAIVRTVFTQTDLLDTQQTVQPFTSSTQGTWDMFVISFGSGSAVTGFNYNGQSIPTTIVLSDDPQ